MKSTAPNDLHGRRTSARGEASTDGERLQARHRRILGGLLAAIAAGAVVLGATSLHAGKPPSRPASRGALTAEREARAPEQRDVVMAAVGAPRRDLPPLPRSLQGTDVDGELRVDAQGNLILGPEVLRLFNYFLNALGEESLDVIKARILAAIHERVGEPAASQAAQLLDKYLAYREALNDLAVRKGNAPDLNERLEALRRLRREHFGDAGGDAMFGDEERIASVAIKSREVMADKTLSDEERAARLAALEGELPEAERKAREAATAPSRQRAEEARMRAAGASDADIYSYRVDTVGPEAADRLAELDRQRAEWDRRIEAFRAARAEIDARITDPRAQRAAEQKLLDASFTPQEQIRVRVILSMND